MRKEFKKMNKVMIGFMSLSVFLLFFVLFAENTGAVLLAPLPGTEAVDEDPGSYLKVIYELTIGIAGVLAVLMLVIGGVEYIASAANPSSKESAKKRIWAAIGGLLLALSAFIILQTINPKLVDFKLNLDKIDIPKNDNVRNVKPPKKKTVTDCYNRVCKGYLLTYKKYNPSLGDVLRGKSICDKTNAKRGCNILFNTCSASMPRCTEEYRRENISNN